MIRCRCLRQRQSNDKALLSSLGYENLHGRRQVYAHGYPRTYCDGSPRVSGTSGSNSCMVFVYETGTSTLAFIQKARALGFRRARSVLPSCRSNVQARGGLRHTEHLVRVRSGHMLDGQWTPQLRELLLSVGPDWHAMIDPL